MRRLIAAAVLIILAIAGVWLYMTVSDMITARQDLQQRFQNIVLHYVSMQDVSVRPLLANPELLPGDYQSLQAVDEKLTVLRSASAVEEQYPALLDAQKSIIQFFTNPNLPLSMTTDPRYIQWNASASNLGQASVVVRAYNEALSAYNYQQKSPVAGVADFFGVWNHTLYLSVDGSEAEQTYIAF